MRIAGAVLAGGQGRRMGGLDKPSLELGGRRLIEHALDRLQPQVTTIAISANGDPARYASLGLDILPDDPAYRAGPLAGLATMLRHFSAQPELSHIVTVPADAPFIPGNLVPRLCAELGHGTEVAVAQSGDRVHPVVGLWPVALLARLEQHLMRTQKLSIMAFLERIEWQAVAFSPHDGIDPFLNVNTPEDLAYARSLVAGRERS
ncbi:molybdenum cofactor guanylyltransferase MobA [Pseudohoeflea suaedae]|uniref:Molybdenum cofactor guanylyltransferase n=1 Tax=Pseudohoeflea suaedae TaxID=877384 RepID=A0A4R5PJY4_9HYPH|nr:molybdenum cofactor guanylyltransferase MobA [Pseudohoeflea suaedae]TDH36000.1 molybdenum cofactor guanylyltransferase MobA [Pseudohoeflea suaedae]